MARSTKTSKTLELPKGIRVHPSSGFIVDITVNGKRRTKTAKTLMDAIKLRESMLEKSAEGLDADGGGEDPKLWTLEYAAHRTIEAVWAGTPSEYIQTNESGRILGYFGRHTHVREITLSRLDAFVAFCLRKGNKGATINRKLMTISRILRTAYDRGIIEKMPKLPTRFVGEHRIRFLSEDEEEHLMTWFDILDLPVHKSFVQILLYTGFRCSELMELEQQDIDMERSLLTVWVTKTHKARTVPIVEKIRPVIERQMERARGQRKLFPYATKAWLYYAWDQVRHRMGKDKDPQFVIHMLRHTCATRLSQSGVPMPLIKEWLGHASILTTVKYTHFSQSELEEAARLLNGTHGE